MAADLSPTDAFALLSDETRLAIVEVLVDQAYESMDDPVSFSDLRRAVGVDDAGKFNYHLGELQPQFVEKREDGYVPRFAALEAVGAARAGTFTELPDERRAGLPYACPVCDGSLVGIHRGSSLRIECENEDGWYFQTIVPPRTAAARSVTEVAQFAFRDMQRRIEKLADGVCMICGGAVETALPASASAFGEDEALLVGFDCTNCSYRMDVPVGMAFVRHPAVVAHHWSHGVDVRDESVFASQFVDPGHATVESTDPFEAHVRVPVEDDVLTLRVDRALNAVER